MRYDQDPIIRVIMSNVNSDGDKELRIDMTAAEFMTFGRFRTRISAHIGRLISSIKPPIWANIVNSKLMDSILTGLPIEASTLGIVKDALESMNVVKDSNEVKATLHRSIYIKDNKAHFELKELIQHLSNSPTGERLKREAIAKALKDMNYRRKQIRRPENPKKQVWVYWIEESRL